MCAYAKRVKWLQGLPEVTSVEEEGPTGATFCQAFLGGLLEGTGVASSTDAEMVPDAREGLGLVMNRMGCDVRVC